MRKTIEKGEVRKKEELERKVIRRCEKESGKRSEKGKRERK